MSASDTFAETHPQRAGFAFKFNGEHVELNEVEHSTTLLELLRDTLDHKGTKASCELQVCGACTVLVNGAPVSSCCTLAVDIADQAVTTIEGLASEANLHPVQHAFVEEFATQCGYCTPGMVLSAAAFIEDEANEANIAGREDRLREFMNGNYCRCTGYDAIVRAVLRAAKVMLTNTSERALELEGSR
jgi:aerobic-type carbon monoxide dehydrogenase small subunit (CoxS/CutS family)